MDQEELEAVRLVSFDGGDILALSQLFILREFMQRVEYDRHSNNGMGHVEYGRDSNNHILPCKYFHMITGVGTGGIIAILLGVLEMGIEETIEEFVTIWRIVYSDHTLQPEARSEKLEGLLSELLEKKDIPENQKLCSENRDETSCKVFVSVATKGNLEAHKKFRSYNSREYPTNPTIIEAIRATCAVPTLFTSVDIGPIGRQVSFMAAYSLKNPTLVTIQEACEHFGKKRAVTCVLSLGTGQREALPLEQLSNIKDFVALGEIASGGEQVHEELVWRIHNSRIYRRLNMVYYRLNVNPPFKLGQDFPENLSGDIMAWTNNYLQTEEIKVKMDLCIGGSKKHETTTLEEIAGVSGTVAFDTWHDFYALLKRLYSSVPQSPTNTLISEGCEWSETKPEIKSWIEEDGSPKLWLYGKPGVGKSNLAKHLLVRARRNESQTEPILSLFCSRTSGKWTRTAIISSLVAQLLSTGRCYIPAVKLLVDQSLVLPDHHLLTFDALSPHWPGLLKSFPSVRIIIDALDECNEDFMDIFSLFGARCKVLLLSRREHWIQACVEDWPSLEIGGEGTVQHDMEIFVSRTVEILYGNWPRLKAKKPTLKEDLLRIADGMFLYVHLLHEAIKIKKDGSLEDIMDTLNHLPRGLASLYTTYLEALIRRIRATEPNGKLQKLSIAALQWILHSPEPLTTTLLERMLAIKPGDEALVEDRIQRNIEERLRQGLGVLVDFRKTDGGIYVLLCHHSLREYLLNCEDHASVKEYLEPLHEAYTTAFITCTTVMCFPETWKLWHRFYDTSEQYWHQRGSQENLGNLEGELDTGEQWGEEWELKMQRRLLQYWQLRRRQEQEDRMRAEPQETSDTDTDTDTEGSFNGAEEPTGHQLRGIPNRPTLQVSISMRPRINQQVLQLPTHQEESYMSEGAPLLSMENSKNRVITHYSLNYVSYFLYGDESYATTGIITEGLDNLLYMFMRQVASSASTVAGDKDLCNLRSTLDSPHLIELICALQTLVTTLEDIFYLINSEQRRARSYRQSAIITAIRSFQKAIFPHPGPWSEEIAIFPPLDEQRTLRDRLQLVTIALANLKMVESTIYGFDRRIFMPVGTYKLVRAIQYTAVTLARRAVFTTYSDLKSSRFPPELVKYLERDNSLRCQLIRPPPEHNSPKMLLLDKDLWRRRPISLSLISACFCILGDICPPWIWIITIFAMPYVARHLYLLEMPVIHYAANSFLPLFIIGKYVSVLLPWNLAGIVLRCVGLCFALHLFGVWPFTPLSRHGHSLQSVMLNLGRNKARKRALKSFYKEMETNILPTVLEHALSGISVAPKAMSNIIIIFLATKDILAFMIDPNCIRHAQSNLEAITRRFVALSSALPGASLSL